MAPAFDRAEIAGERICIGAQILPAMPAETSEIQFMQQRRVERRHLVALEAADNLGGRGARIERFEFRRDGVQAAHRTAVVALVVALDQAWRDAAQGPWAAEQGCELVLH